MLDVIRKSRDALAGLNLRRTHPHIRSSTVGHLREIDRAARVTNSKLMGDVSLGPHAIVDDCRIVGNRRVSIGARSILSGPIRIIADLNPVSIGKFCSLAPDVAIWESLHDASRLSTHFLFSELFGERFERDIVSKGAIVIGHDVWIGTKAVILSGVTIGHGAVIGAGSVVTNNVAPYMIVGGTPAVALRSRFAEETCRRLLDLQWWDWDDETIWRNRALFEGVLTPDRLTRFFAEPSNTVGSV